MSTLDDVNNDLYIIGKEVRDCALHTFRKKQFEVQKEELEYLISNCEVECFYIIDPFELEDGEYVDIFIYRYPHQKKMYEMARLIEGELGKTYGSEFILGTLLGYQGPAMERYLKKKFPNK